VLTANGQRQAAAVASVVSQLSPPPQLIVCSPLTRALQTADLAFKGYDCPRIMTHLAAERLYHASDVRHKPPPAAAHLLVLTCQR
jgi:broad specificity phosphatase PhoE